MPSKPRTPRNTVKLSRLPRVGEEILMKVTVRRVAPRENRDETYADVTVELPNGQRSTGAARYMLDLDD